MIKNPLAGFDLSNPFGTDAMKRSRNLFGVHTTPRDWKHGARDIPFGMGAASLHVDGTDGDDSNDGESWITAKKTIQEAVGAADSWTQIFIKAGTYAENVTIATDTISLIGQSRDEVDIHPTSGVALTVPADTVTITNLSLYAAQTYCAILSGENLTLDTIRLNGAAEKLGIELTTPNHTTLNNIYASNSNLATAITATGTAKYLTISNSKFNLTHGAPGYSIYLSKTSKSRVFNNDIGAMSGGSGYGMWIVDDCSDLSIFHNNFIGNNTQVHEGGGTRISLFENFYDDHSNVDNGFGIAKAPYAYTGGTDPRPVVCRNGWLGLSWADADLVADILADVTGIAGAAMRGTDNAALASALTTHDGKLDTVDGIVDAILADTTGLNGDAMRGTNSAALASVCTGTRLAELDAANLPTDIDAILADVTGIAGAAMRGTNNAALASVCTETRLAELDAANLPADIDTLLARMCQHHGAAYAELITSGDSANPAINYDTVANNTTIISVPITITERCCIVVNAALLEYADTLATEIEIERPFGTPVTTQRDNVPTGGLELFHHAAWEVLDAGTYTYYLVNRAGRDLYVIAAWIKAVASDCVGT